MRTPAAMLSVVAFTLSFGAIAAPQGMAPYPGQIGENVAPKPPPQPGGGGPAHPGDNRAITPTPAKPLKPAACVWSRQMSQWSPVDDRSMIVHQGSKRYLVTFNGVCKDSRHEYGMNIDTRFSPCLSSGDRVTFASPFGLRNRNMVFPCYIKKIEELPKQA
jgi:hypothetical protein